MKSVLSKSLALIAIAFFLVPATIATNFSDVPPTHPNYSAIQYLSESEILQGQRNGLQFTPEQPINRAEWAQILIRYSGLIADPADRLNRDCFLDVFSEWYAPPICFAARQGWIKGYQAGEWQGKFIPTNVLNKAEILITISRVLGWTTSEGAEWWTGVMAYAKNAKIIDASSQFDEPITRGQAAEILFRSMVLHELKVSRYDPFLIDLIKPPGQSTPADPVPPKTQKVVNLSLFPEQPSNQTLAKGSLYVPVLRFQLEAQQEVTLSQVTIRRVSAGATEDLSMGRLLVNGMVLKENQFFTPSNTIVWSKLNVRLPANETVLLEMTVDFVENAQPILEYQFEISPDQLVFTDPEVTVSGKKITGKAYSVSPVPADKVTVKNPVSAIKLPFVESEEQILARFQIAAGDHDILIRRIKVENAGSIDDRHLINLRLTTAGEVVGTVEKGSGHIFDFAVSDYLIEKGETRTFTILGDILGAQKVDSVRFFIPNPEDVYAFDIQYGFGTRVINEFGLGQAWCAGTKSIQCPAEGLRKHCSKEDIEGRVRDCDEE